MASLRNRIPIPCFPAAICLPLILGGCDDSSDLLISENNAPTVEKSVTSLTGSLDAERAEAGRLLHARIVDQYSHLDPIHRKPFLWGALSQSPKVIISVPKEDWDKLPSDDRLLLESYAQSQIVNVKKAPFSYLNLSPAAPAASTIRQRASAMTDTSWGIMVGNLSGDQRDILADHFAIQGAQK